MIQIVRRIKGDSEVVWVKVLRRRASPLGKKSARVPRFWHVARAGASVLLSY